MSSLLLPHLHFLYPAALYASILNWNKKLMTHIGEVTLLIFCNTLANWIIDKPAIEVMIFRKVFQIVWYFKWMPWYDLTTVLCCQVSRFNFDYLSSGHAKGFELLRIAFWDCTFWSNIMLWVKCLRVAGLFKTDYLVQIHTFYLYLMNGSTFDQGWSRHFGGWWWYCLCLQFWRLVSSLCL